VPDNPVIPDSPSVPQAPEGALTTPVPTAAPEPAAWMMLILGFAVNGAAMRIGRRKAAKASD
jgi:hypothetical protein